MELNLSKLGKMVQKAIMVLHQETFPNLFQLLGPNTILGHNSVIFMIESQVNYILQLIQTVDKTGSQAVEIKHAVQDQFNDRVQEQLKGTVWQAGGCSSWYQAADGKTSHYGQHILGNIG
jgi:cation diffusion facilitator CzcD-associated flavoprotein CzcO